MIAPLAVDRDNIAKPFDPLGLAVNIRAGQLYFYREAELKNGRLAMLGFLSIVVNDKLGVHPWFTSSKEYISAVQSHALIEPFPRNFWFGLVVACGFAELFAYPDRSTAPGDLGFDPLGFKPTNPKELLEMQNKELNNGRLAMFATMGMIAQEMVTG